MIAIPAIDIRGGKVVRLSQGEYSRQTIYAGSPLETAKKWASFGVEMIHIVDLDGALEGGTRNLDIIGEIARSIKPKIELGGGLRSEASIEKAIAAGIDRVVIGTKALNGEFLDSMVKKFGERIVAGIDARSGVVCTKGWVEKTKLTAIELARRIADAGVRTINYTDITRDGMLEGPNIDSLKGLLAATKLDVVAAGGVSNTEDLIKLKALENKGLKGVIIGKALYEGRLDLGEAIEICSRKE
ncbi:MAG: 1-(5-phosphoribosyl)-5-[(5-phosphoribosylamino)methylideneamino]imidazole-4-carboxamide isomerase [Candidatus Omnitrophica bacterium]|nr:1-(5-phosphoribosyl)-5-[(5-phosphoribosylamino)methylideneamino]imidazole-4-carboxamide isomerase [Candidatus Omnitrophota bacterium]